LLTVKDLLVFIADSNLPVNNSDGMENFISGYYA